MTLLLKLKVSSINDTKSNCNGTVSIPFLKEYRYGNKLFIYFSARIYAELNKLNLITNIDDIYYDLKPTKNYGKPPKNLKTFIIQDKDYNKTKNKINFKGKGNYVFNGYFQFLYTLICLFHFEFQFFMSFNSVAQISRVDTYNLEFP